jgi:hypothetical protein
LTDKKQRVVTLLFERPRVPLQPDLEKQRRHLGQPCAQSGNTASRSNGGANRSHRWR